MEAASIAIHSSIAKEICALLPARLNNTSLIKTFECDAKSVFRNPVLSILSSSSHYVVFLPGHWVSDIPLPPKELILKCVTGVMRFVFWKPTLAPKWTLPNTIVPATADLDSIHLIVNNICRIPAWGLHTTMPIGSTVLTDRIYTREQLNRRVETSIELLIQHDNIFSTCAGRIKAGVQQLVATAFGVGETLPGSKPPTFQFAYHAGLSGHSIRWQGPVLSTQEWLNPSEDWQSVLNSNSLTFVQVSPETAETEVIVTNTPITFQGGPSPRPIAVEVITVDRITSSNHLLNEMEAFAFGVFE